MSRCRSSVIHLLFTAIFSIVPTLAGGVTTDHPEDVVQMLAGTDTPDGWAPSTGNTLPQVKTPWGFNDWAPETNFDLGAWWFRRSDDSFHGMRCTHQPSPWIGDYGHFVLQPHVSVTPLPLAWSADSDTTVFRPYLFNATFESIQFEFVPTSHAAILRMNFPKSAKFAHLSLSINSDDGGAISVDKADMSIRGHTEANSGGVPKKWKGMYFSARALSKAHDMFTNNDDRWRNEKTGTLVFENSEAPIFVAVATSFISQDQADLNLEQEVGTKSFAELLTEGRARWAEELGRIQVDAIDKEQLTVFYTNLWRSMLFPRYLQEVDTGGQEVHRSPYTGKVHQGKLVADSGFWDSYLTVYHLHSVVFPEELGKIVDGWVKAYEEATWLPQWASPGQVESMVGTMGDVVLADAIAKSKWGFLSGFDVEKAYQAIRKDAFDEPEGLYGRQGMQEYIDRGYVSSNFEMSATRTMNYYVSDAAIARAAGLLGKRDDERTLRKRSKRYHVIFNKKSRFFEPKDASGHFLSNYNPRFWGNGFTEGGAWQYRFYLPHDVEGLQKLYNGRLCEAIQDMMSLTQGPPFEGGYDGRPLHEMTELASIQKEFGQYAHNNQPVHHILYVAKKAGCNAIADKYLRKVMQRLYTARGWAGDEDNGEMAAWYVLSAMGIFALEGAKDEMVLGSPSLAHASVQLRNGKTLQVTTTNQAHDNVYVHSVTWTPEDGSSYVVRDNVLKFSELMRGGKLKFVMGSEPKPSTSLRGARRH